MAVHAPAPVAVPPSAQHRGRRLSDDDWNTSMAGPSGSPPRVNPYHLIHHPTNSDDPLPPLPPHLERLATGLDNSDDEDDSDTSDEESDVDDDDLAFDHEPTLVANGSVVPNIDGVAVASPNVEQPGSQDSIREGSPETKQRTLMKKVSSVFRRGDQGVVSPATKAEKVPPVPKVPVGLSPRRGLSPQPQQRQMQGPPPSPPLSDTSDDEYASSVAVTEGTVESDLPHPPAMSLSERAVTPDHGAPLMPVTEAGESKVALELEQPAFTMNLTAEPEATTPLETSSPSQSVRSRGTSRERPTIPAFLGIQQPRRVSSGSTSSRAGSLSMVRSGRLAPQRDPTASPEIGRSPLPAADMTPGSSPTITNVVPSGAAVPNGPSPQPDVYETPRQRANLTLPTPLPPPRLDMSFKSASSSPVSQNPPRITRRNTNPTQSTSPIMGRALTQSVSVASHAPPSSIPFDDFNLPADILAQTEILRRERLERRQKKQMSMIATTVEKSEEITTTPTADRRSGVRRKETEETKVLVGNLVGEGHRNYVLMYNMLTGIRVAVSRCQAKIKRPITDEDYTARHKYTFDMLGNELTPSAKYDFKFKDYAPWVFRELRDEHFHLDPADYLLSLTAKYILSEVGSPGKSGSFFYYSRDYRFIIKTISHSEHNFLRSILKDYHAHVRANPHTLLSRFYGLHRVKIPRGRKIHFVIMNNLFPPHRDIHETYDLKGSAFGREYPEDKAKTNPRAVLKDINWVNRGRTLEFGPEKRALLAEQLRRDMEFLKRINVMDYSLLVGIHNMERGNRDNLRQNTLAVFHPNTQPVHRKPSSVKQHAEAHNVRRAVARSDPKRLLDVSGQLPEDGSADRKHFLFYQDEGGLRATDEQNQPLDLIYYLGVIDICTPYNTHKRIEHAWKSMTEDPVTISCVNPNVYGNRFLDFLNSVMRGGDPALRPAGLESSRRMIDGVPEKRPAPAKKHGGGGFCAPCGSSRADQLEAGPELRTTASNHTLPIPASPEIHRTALPPLQSDLAGEARAEEEEAKRLAAAQEIQDKRQAAADKQAKGQVELKDPDDLAAEAERQMAEKGPQVEEIPMSEKTGMYENGSASPSHAAPVIEEPPMDEKAAMAAQCDASFGASDADDEYARPAMVGHIKCD